MDDRQEVLDLAIIFTQPPPGSPPEILAHVAFQCDALGLSHTGEMFTDPLAQQEWDDLHWYLEEYWQWPYLEFAERGKRVEALLGEVGRRFYQALFGSQEAYNIVQTWQQQINAQHRISIVSEIANILRLPWELLADSQGFLVLQADHSISLVRRLSAQGEQASLSTSFQLPLRVLLVTARPEDAGFVDPRSISHEMVDELQRQSETGTIELEFLRPPTFTALSARLKNTERPIHVLHFDGHGGVGGKEQQGILLFETEAGNRSPIEAKNLAKALKNSGVRLAVLTACQSAMDTKDDALSSVSTQLINNGVDAVIAMSSSILVTSAALYTEAFYRALAEGLSVSIANEQARQALHRDPHRHLFNRHRDEEAAPVTLADWWIPHFYQQRLLTLHATTAPREHSQLQTSRYTHFNDAMPPEPRYHFGGRARELLQIERHLLHKRLVIISGFGGVGKTVLAREAADWLTRTGMYSCACFVSFEHGGDASLLLSTLGAFLGINDGNYTPQNPDTALARLQSALSARPTLLIVDNLESLLPSGEAPLERAARSELWHVLHKLVTLSAGVLITSRDPLASEDQLAPGTHVANLHLSGLTSYDAYALATRLLEDLAIERTRAPYADLRDLLAQLDHHPLAIQLILPTLSEHSLDTILADFVALLPPFTDDTTTGRQRSLLASLEYSLQRLSPEHQSLLPPLAIFEGGASENELLQIIQIPGATWLPLKSALVRAGLLTLELIHETLDEFFLHFHPIFLPYLRQKTGEQKSNVELTLRQGYVKQYASLARYLNSEVYQRPEIMFALARCELPNLRATLEFLLQVDDLDAASRMIDELADIFTNLGLIRERDQLQQRIEHAVATSSTQTELTYTAYSWEIRKAQEEQRSGKWQAAFIRLRRLLTRIQVMPEGSEVGPDSFLHSRVLQELGHCQYMVSQYTAALDQFQAALTIIDTQLVQKPKSRDLRIVHAGLLYDLGRVFGEQGLYAQAQTHYEQTLQEQDTIHDYYNKAVTLGTLGDLALQQQDYHQAHYYHQQTLQYFQEVGNPQMQATAWEHLGTIAIHQQNWTEAEQCFRASLILYEQIGDPANVATTFNELAVVAERSGHPKEAESWFKRALELIANVEPGSMKHALYLNNLAILLVDEVQARRAERSRLVEARRYLEQVRLFKEQPDVSAGIWETYSLLARIAELEEKPEVARNYHRQARESYAAFPSNRYKIDQHFRLFIIAIVAAIHGNPQKRDAVIAAFPALGKSGWHISESIQRVWAGERNWHALAEDMAVEPALLILRVLETIASPENAPAHPTPEALLASLPTSVFDALQQGDQAAFDQALAPLAPEEQQQVLAVLQMLQELDEDGEPEQGA